MISAKSASRFIVSLCVLGFAAPASAALSVNPRTISVAQGQTSAPLLAAASFAAAVPPAGTTGTVAFGGLPPGVTTTPSPVVYTFTGAPAATTSFRVIAAPTATPGTYAVTLTGSGNVGSAMLALTVTPATQGPPAITRLLPQRLAAGSVSTRVILVGRNFAANAQAVTTSAWIRIERSRQITATLFEAFVSVAADAPLGPQPLEVLNANGTSSQKSPPLLILPPNSPAGSLAVTSLLIATPRAGSFVASSAHVRPRGVLVASGTGFVTGRWLVDGVPFDHFARAVVGGRRVELRAQTPIPPLLEGEHALQLALDAPSDVRSQPLTFLVTSATASELRLIAPVDDAVLLIGAAPPTFRWSIMPGAVGYQLELEREGGHAPRSWRLSEPECAFDDETYRALEPGVYRWRVRAVFVADVRGDFTPTRTFTLAARAGRSDARPRLVFASQPVPPANEPATPTVPAQQPGAGFDPLRRDNAILTLQTALTTMRVNDETVGVATPPDSIRGHASGQADIARREAFLRANGDIGYRIDLHEESPLARENRNWIAQLGAPSEENKPRARLTIGHAPPSFTDRAEILMAGLPQAGIQGSLGASILTASAYRSIQESSAGAFSGFSMQQDVTAAAVEIGRNPGVGFVRGIWLHVEDPGSAYAPPATGQLLGLLARLALGPKLEIMAEAAHGDTNAADAPPAAEQTGNAWRVTATGSAGLSSYMFALRNTEDGFVNPLNRGLMPGGIPSQWSADGNFSRMFTNGAGSLMLAARHAVTAMAADDEAPDVSDDMATASLTMGSGRPAALTLAGTASRQRAEAYAALALPETDRYTLDGNATLAETLGTFSFSQSAACQMLRDRVDSLFDTTTYTGTIMANGMAGSAFVLSAMATGTRSQADPLLGTTETLMLTAQPAFQSQRAGLRLAGNLLYTKTKNDVQLLDATTEQYGALATWNPTWGSWSGALQVSIDWLRSRDLYSPEAPFVRRVGVAFTFGWSATRGAFAPPPLMLPASPGATPAPAAGSPVPGRMAALLSQLRASAIAPYRARATTLGP